jgi:hypothetical protein
MLCSCKRIFGVGGEFFRLSKGWAVRGSLAGRKAYHGRLALSQSDSPQLIAVANRVVLMSPAGPPATRSRPLCFNELFDLFASGN